MVVFDTSFLISAIDPNVTAPVDPATMLPITEWKARIEFLLKELEKNSQRILLPTPVVAEFLVKAGPGRAQYVDRFQNSKHFTIGDFNILSAIELSMLVDPDLNSLKTMDAVTSKAKIRFDRQIIAIAKVEGANKIYADDRAARVAERNGFEVVLSADLPLPPLTPQGVLGLEYHSQDT